MESNIPDIDNLPGIQPDRLSNEDVKALDGTRIKIASAEVKPMQSKFGKDQKELSEGQTRQVYDVICTTEPFGSDKIGREVTISESFHLKEDPKSGQWGVNLNDMAKSKKLFVKLGVETFKEAVGRELIVVESVNPKNNTSKLIFSI